MAVLNVLIDLALTVIINHTYTFTSKFLNKRPIVGGFPNAMQWLIVSGGCTICLKPGSVMDCLGRLTYLAESSCSPKLLSVLHLGVPSQSLDHPPTCFHSTINID